MSNSTSVEQRFWSKVKIGKPDECWEWQAGQSGAGYGQIRIDHICRYSHRLAYEFTKGPIPDGKEVCHSCDNRACCNPAHLWLGSHMENMTDMARKDRVGTSKLNIEQVKEIRSLYASGKFTLLQLGMKYHVHLSTIAYAINGKNWNHVD